MRLWQSFPGMLLCSFMVVTVRACTMIALGRKATTDGSTMAIQTNDCIDCDFRLGIVPSTTSSGRAAVWPVRFAYPRYVGSDRGDLYALKDVDTSIYPWTETSVMGYADFPDMGNSTRLNSYLDGTYPLISEKQLGFAETTCGARLVAAPVSDGGKALMDVSALMRLAIERTSTARDAIKFMGQLAERYGFYGAVWTGPAAYNEAGEALAVIDPQEAWLFHVCPDDTGASAVWVAVRLGDDQIAAVANQFVIRNVDIRDPNVLASSNMEEVAVRAGLWDPKDGTLAEGTFDFTRAYGVPHGKMSPLVTRRVWRIQSVAAPSLNLPHSSDVWGSDYPMSVKPDQPMSLSDIKRLLRDNFEGTEFDLTVGLAAGAFGDPTRFDMGTNLDGVTIDIARQGHFERGINLFRTSYAFIVQARADKPAPIGGMAWIGYHAPDTSVFTPFYGSALAVAPSHSVGSLFKVNKNSAFWGHAAAANYMARYYKHSIIDFRMLQANLEPAFEQTQKVVEMKALKLINEGHTEEARKVLTDFSIESATQVYDSIWDLFYTLLSRFKDGYRLDNTHQETYRAQDLFYPLSWLKGVGYFPPVNGAGVQSSFTTPTAAATGTTTTTQQQEDSSSSHQSSTNTAADDDRLVVLAAGVGCVAGALVTTVFHRRRRGGGNGDKQLYSQIP